VHPARRDDLIVVSLTAIPLALFLLSERQIAGASGFPLDDSWIHLHFARNIAEGGGFSYNPGVPVAGSTAPLWTLLLAAGVALAGSSLGLVKGIGVALLIGAALVTRRAAIAWGVSPPAALIVSVLCAWSGAMVWGALSGMEVPLAALLVAATLWVHASGSAGWTALFGALAVLARPEALILLPLLALARPLDRRRAAAFILIPLLALAPAIAFNMATVGAPIPSTAAAKVEGGLVGWLSGLREPILQTWVLRPWSFFREWVIWLGGTHWLLPLSLPGVLLAWWRGGRALGLPALALLAHPLAMALLAPYRGPGFQEGRYSIHLLPLAWLMVALLLGRAATRRMAVALTLVLLLSLPQLWVSARRYGWAVENINDMQVELGRWIDRTLPGEARLAVNDVGAIAFFSRREVIDLMGLVTPDILPYRRHGEDGVLQYLEQSCPDYLIIFPSWFPKLSERSDLFRAIHSVHLDRNVVSGGDTMVVYETVWNRWAPSSRPCSWPGGQIT
jgi:hypothetical protein